MGVKVEDIGVTRGKHTPDMVSESVTSLGTWTNSRASPGLSFPVCTWRCVLATLYWGALSPSMPSSSCLKPANPRGQSGVVACSGRAYGESPEAGHTKSSAAAGWQVLRLVRPSALQSLWRDSERGPQALCHHMPLPT